MRIFLEKYCKNRLSVGGSATEPPFASSGWGLLASLLSPTITILSSSCLALNVLRYSLKKIK